MVPLVIARLVSRLGLAATLVFAMVFGLRPEPSALEVTSVTADENDHVAPQHEPPADAHELIAEAEETRDELEERPELPVGLLCARAPALVSMRATVPGATYRGGRPRLGVTAGLGRGPPVRA